MKVHTLCLALIFGLVSAAGKTKGQNVESRELGIRRKNWAAFRSIFSCFKVGRERQSVQAPELPLGTDHEAPLQMIPSPLPSASLLEKDQEEAIQQIPSLSAFERNIMDAKIKEFYALKARVDGYAENSEESDGEIVVEGSASDWEHQITKLEQREKASTSKELEKPLGYRSILDVFSGYLLKMELNIDGWELMNAHRQAYHVRRVWVQAFRREKPRMYMSLYLRRLSVYTELCELLIQVYKEDIWAKLAFSPADIPIPLVKPNLFEELTERPLAALRNGNVGYTLTLIPANQLQAFEAKILQQRKEYCALYDRISRAHFERFSKPILTADVMLLLTFSFEVQFTWIAMDYHTGFQQLHLQPGSPIFGDHSAQDAVAYEVEWRKQRYDRVERQFTALSIEHVQNLIWPNRLLLEV